MAERKAVTKQMAHRYAKASKKDKGAMLEVIEGEAVEKVRSELVAAS